MAKHTVMAESETDTLLENEHGLVSDFSGACRVAVFAGGAYVCCAIVPTLFTFTTPKIINSTGFSHEAVAMCQTFFWIGFAVASVLVMPIVDLVGRRAPMFLLLAIGVCAAILTSTATTVWLYGAMCLVGGLTIAPCAQISYLLATESIPNRWCPIMTVCLNLAYSGVILVMSLVCKATQHMNWRTEVVLWQCPFVLLLLSGPFFVQESPAFQKARGSQSAASKESELSTVESDSPLARLCRPPLMGCLIASCMCWAACSISFYGLTFAAGDLSSDMYVSMALLALVDMLGYGIPGPLMACLSPIGTQILGFGLAVPVFLACELLVAKSQSLLLVALCGRLLIDIAFTTVFILLVEFFPETCRSSAMGILNLFARIGTMAAPMLPLLSIHSICAILSALCCVAVVSTFYLLHASKDHQVFFSLRIAKTDHQAKSDI